MSEVNRLEWDAYIRDSELMASVNRIERRVSGMVDNVNNRGKDMENVFANMAKAATAFFTLSTAESFIQKLISVRSEFQQLDIAFTTMLGSKEKADQLTKDLIEFAGTTPFGMKDTSNAAKQLLAYGSTAKNVKDELRMLGDIASGTSQPIGELVYLYGTLRTQGQAYLMDIRQFAGRGIPIYRELATVLGVAESQVNGLVSAGKVGFEQVQKALQNMTATGSMFGGLMEAQSKTIQGELERLGDAYDQMLNKIGTDTEGMISQSIQGLSALVENYQTVLNIIGGLISVYGAYRAALIATAALQQLSAARVVGMTTAEILHLGAITAKTAAMKALNAIMLASPVILMTTGIVALSAAIYALTQVTDATSAAQEKLANIQESGIKRSDQERRTIEQLTSIIKDNRTSLEERTAAYDKLQAQTKGILSSFTMEEIAIGKATAALDLYIQKIGRAASARKAFDEFNSLAEQLDEINRKGIEGVGIWNRAGRAIQNAFGVNGGKAAKSFWGFGDTKTDDFIANQQKDVLKAQMKELEKEFGTEFKSFITGVEQTTKNATPSDLFAKSLKDPIKNFNSLVKAISNKSDVDSLKKALTEKLESLAPGDSQISAIKSKLKEISKLEDQYSTTKTASSSSRVENQQYQAAERYLSMLEQIESVKKQALNNQLSSDEQEVASVREKYNSLRNEIRKFNDDPKNKVKINGKRVDQLENSEINSVLQKQSNDRRLKNYEQDYQNYIKYENLKKEAGYEVANEQYGAFKDTYSKLQNEINALQGRKFTEGLSPVDESYLNGLELLFSNHLQKLKDDKVNSILETLKLSESSNEAELRIRKKYQDAYEELEKNKTSITLEEFEKRKSTLSKNLSEELSNLFSADLKKSADWGDVFDGIMQKTAQEAELSVEKLKNKLIKLLGAGKITIEEYRKALSSIKDVEIQINTNSRGFNDLKQAIKLFKEAKGLDREQKLSNLGMVANSYFQSGLDSIREIGGIFDQLGIGSERFKENFADTVDLLSNAGNLAQSIMSGDVMGMIQNGIKTISSAIKLFSKDKGLERQIKSYQNQLDSLEKSFKKINDLINNSVGDSFYTDSNKAIENLKQQQKVLQQMAKAEEDKKKTDADKVKQYNNEIESINDKIKEIESSINQTLIQTTFKDFANELTNALVSAFEAGEDAIDGMDKTYQKFIKNALVNSLKFKFIETEVKNMTDALAAYMSGNNNSLLGFNFDSWKEKLNQAGAGFTDALNQAYSGLGLTKDGDSNSSLKAEQGITRISESTGTEIVGMYRAGYDLQKQHLLAFQTFKDSYNSNSAKYLTIANDKLTALNAIQVNTANTVTELKNAVTELKAINKNTGGGRYV